MSAVDTQTAADITKVTSVLLKQIRKKTVVPLSLQNQRVSEGLSRLKLKLTSVGLISAG